MHPTLVILAVGLSPALIGEHTPHLKRLVARGGMRPLNVPMPAVTCTVQASLLTGLAPTEHGIVANGWYFRDSSEIAFWKQSNHLVVGEKIWEAGRKQNAAFTCAKMFWWYNMYSSADWSATPRPMYPADGRKIPDHYAFPKALHDELDAKLGQFPLFKFWGPLTDISSSEWIAKATLHVMQTRNPTLTLTYLPHLDYSLQRLGPDLSHPRIQQDLKEIDAVCGTLIDYAENSGRDVVVVSEYGITPVTEAIHINRALRRAGLLEVRPEEFGREILDAGASAAFAVVDHQLAHIYVKDAARLVEVRALVEGLDGVEQVLDADGKRAMGLNHERSGELVAISKADRWFSYYYWLDDSLAPDFARTVDIHRKPGYDPVELFVDPELRFPMLATGWKLAKRKLGLRALLDVISLKDTAQVKGSHGRIIEDTQHGPLVISSRAERLPTGPVDATAFKQFVLDHIFSAQN
jgi:predicted AlkP superfamily pyrophosphatase or phosphodiesterase